MANSNLDATLASKINHYVNGAWFVTTLQQIKTLVIPDLSGYVAQYVNQNVTPTSGATVQVSDASNNVFLLVQGGPATLTIKMPSNANAVNGQEINIVAVSAITTLNWDENGALSIVGEPATLAAGGFLTLRYHAEYAIWYRVA